MVGAAARLVNAAPFYALEQDFLVNLEFNDSVDVQVFLSHKGVEHLGLLQSAGESIE